MTEAEELTMSLRMAQYFKHGALQETFVARTHFQAGYEQGLIQGKAEAHNDTNSLTELQGSH